jgi:hypothetical protein
VPLCGVSLYRVSFYAEFRNLVYFAECHCAECPYTECRYAECQYIECRYAECRYAKCRYAECQYAECHYMECRYAGCHYAECCYAKCHGTNKMAELGVRFITSIFIHFYGANFTQPFLPK